MKSWQIGILIALSASALYLYSQEQPQASIDFDLWKAEFNMNFADEEESFRKMIFLQNIEDINGHNADTKQTYKKGTNQFTHLSNNQFKEMFLSSIYYRENHAKSPIQVVETIEPLRDVDWQALGKVSGVKDQGSCDAGYAFCSSSLIESFYLLQNKNVSLSEQQIVDCSASYTTFGCQSGSRNGTLTYIREKGLTTTAAYPYRGVKNNCQKEVGEFKPTYTHVEFNGCQNIKTGLYGSPLTVAVNAQTWQTYKSGVYNGCTSTEVNHDILLIGVTSDYWRLKNSWGIKWGEYGFIRLAAGNTCGICEKPGFGFKK